MPSPPAPESPQSPDGPVARFRHEAVSVVFRVTESAPGPRLTVLGWQRFRDPFTGAWSVPSGPVGADESVGTAAARHLAAKVDLTELAHLEQLETRSEPTRDPFDRTIATAYLGLVPVTADPVLPDNAAWLDAAEPPEMAFDHASVIAAARDRLRSKLSYTNLGFALAPAEFTISQLRGIYRAALGHDVAATNLQRVLERRGQLEFTGNTSPARSGGGRPARLYRFTRQQLQITDPFAALRP